MVTSTLSLCSDDAFALIDIESTYSYVPPYFALCLDRDIAYLDIPIKVLTPVREYVRVDKVYHDCLISVQRVGTAIDLMILEMVEFDIIMGIYWWVSCHANLECYTKTMIIRVPERPRVTWRGVKGNLISVMKTQKMIGKGFLDFIAIVYDNSAEKVTIDRLSLVLT